MVLRLGMHTSGAGLAIVLYICPKSRPDIVLLNELYGLVLAQMS
jgi:hypothetical protein